MNATLDNLVDGSVFLWLENLLVNRGAGFTNYSGQFLPTNSENVGWNCYAAPQRQIVYDSSVSGVQVPSGVYSNGTFIPVSSGLQINFYEAAVYSQATLTQPVTAAYSFKDVNIYFTSHAEEKVLFEKGFSLNPRSNNTYTSLPNEQVYPCIFIKPRAGRNKTLSF